MSGESGSQNSGGDLINLEDLVKGLDAPSDSSAGIARSMEMPSSPPPQSAAPPPAVEPVPPIEPEKPPEVAEPIVAEPVAVAPPPSSEQQISTVDDILNIEDPSLMAELGELRAHPPFDKDTSTEKPDVLTLEDLLKVQPEGFVARIKHQSLLFRLKGRNRLNKFREISARLSKDAKTTLRELAIEFKNEAIVKLKALLANFIAQQKKFFAAPLVVKISLLAILGLLSLTVFVLKRTLHHQLLPKVEREWVASFNDKSDEVVHYHHDEPWEDFNDPIHHPEFVVLLERVVVNLSRENPTPEGQLPQSIPMAAFELFLQTDNQESAVEVKDRLVEVRDLTARAAEKMVYKDLKSEQGKSKLKLLIRKEINTRLVKGRVRKVFFKTLILNPEDGGQAETYSDSE